MHGQSFDDFPHVARWFFAMSERPAVTRARKIGLDLTAEETKPLHSRPFWDVPATFANDKTEVR
jgi:GST-like protein